MATYHSVFNRKLAMSSIAVRGMFKKLSQADQETIRRQFYRHLQMCIKSKTTTDPNWLHEAILDTRRGLPIFEEVSA